jgi:hypothetical protein
LPSWQGQFVSHGLIDKWSSGVVTARVRSSVQSLHHKRQDLHQLTYLYLLEYREPTPHLVVPDFRLPVRYYHVPIV